MIDPKYLDELVRKIGESIPAGLSDLRDDIEKTARLGLQQMIERMELVTREEFEVQQAVLERTRARLEALEHRVAALEAEARGALQ